MCVCVAVGVVAAANQLNWRVQPSVKKFQLFYSLANNLTNLKQLSAEKTKKKNILQSGLFGKCFSVVLECNLISPLY